MSVFLFTDDPAAYARGDTLLLVVPAKLADKQAVLAWYAESLHFPTHFGANWDAFSDCIRDLSWLAASSIVIAHGDLPMVGHSSDQDIYLDILADAVRSWNEGAARNFKVAFPTKVTRAVENRMIVVGRYLNDTLGVHADREAHEARGRRIIERMKPYGYDGWHAQIDTPLSQLHFMRALEQMEAILRDGEETRGAPLIARILRLNYGSEEFWAAVTDLEIWGGAGSLFDQAFVKDSEDHLSLEFYRVLLDLGGLIEKEGRSTHFVRSATMVLRQLVEK